MKLVSLALRLILAGLIGLIPRSPQVDPGIQLVPEKRGDPPSPSNRATVVQAYRRFLTWPLPHTKASIPPVEA